MSSATGGRPGGEYPPVPVEVEGIEVGRFPLPPLPPGSRPATPRQILNPAFLWGDTGRNLFWIEQTDDDQVVPMVWIPGSDDEAQATYFLQMQADRFRGDCGDEAEDAEDGEDDEDEAAEGAACAPTLPGLQRFIALDRDPPEYRAIAPAGARLHLFRGPIGTPCRSKILDFPRAEAARAEMERWIATLPNEGFVEIVPVKDQIVRSIPPARNPDDPRYWTTPAAWERLRDILVPLSPRLAGHVSPVKPEDIDACEARLGFKFPPSYRAFLAVFGPGSVADFFSISAPGMGDDPAAMTEEMRSTCKSLGIDFVSELYARLEPISRMIFFCRDGGANYFGWNPDDIRDPAIGEYAIFEYPHGWDFVEEVSSSFPEFLIDALMLARNRKTHRTDPRFEPSRRAGQ